MSLKGSWNPGSSFLLCPLGTDHTSPGPLAGSDAMASDPMASLVLRVRGSTDGQVDAWGVPPLRSFLQPAPLSFSGRTQPRPFGL